MPTPRLGYFLKDGTRVPPVTTILSKFKESGGLMHWAWNLGMQGIDYREIRDAAADAGTLAHALVEKWVKGQPLEIDGAPENVAKARNVFDLFLEWQAQTKLEIVETEMQLVSEVYKFGGTPDAMLVSGKLSMGDWKSSNSVYADYMLQLAAYGILWEENFPDRPITGGYHLMRFAKEFPDFVHYHWADLSEAREGFLLMRRLYDIKVTLEKRIK